MINSALQTAAAALAFAAVTLASTPAFDTNQPAPATQTYTTPDEAKDRGWPRDFSSPGYTVRVYAPQLDSWPNFGRITFRAAISVAPAGTEDRTYGLITMSADTSIGYEERLVVLTNRKLESLSFPGTDAQTTETLKAAVIAAMPPEHTQTVSLDRLIAAMDPSTVPVRKVDVNTAPPPIFTSDKPAVMVIFMGPTRFKPAPGGSLLYAINTNWDVFLDPAASRYYLLLGKSWLTTTDLDNGPWTAAASPPADLAKLPADENWKDVLAALPGTPATDIPKVFVSHSPAELVVTQGPPELGLIPGTSLMFVSNTQNELFYATNTQQYYLLTAGRWFKAPAVSGPWAATSDALPEDFKKLPPGPQFNDVLAAVPGTPAANHAMILASIPQKATIKRDGVTVTVTYDGAPKFVPIESTTVHYAANTPFNVFLVDGRYYCCNNAVWFESPTPTGAWTVCSSVPQAIYTIPPTSPKYNVTYVTVYESTPTTVVTGYTAGYSGATVAATGVVMFGLGLAVGAALNDDCCWSYHYNPCYYSYGCGAAYHGGAGGYVAATSYYGPYGGAGKAAAYNPATGTYSRAGYAYGPNGATAYRTAYNPTTGTSAARTATVTPYGSYGSSAVSNGSQWATASHQTTARGTTAQAENSQGGQIATAQGRYGNGATVAQTSSGDMYASKNGNVYKNTGSGWSQANNSEAASNAQREVPQSTRNELQQQSESRSRGEEYSQRANSYQRSYSEQERGGGERYSPSRGGGGSGGGGRRR